MRVLVTGGAGFIGSNFIRHLLNEPGTDLKLVNLDKLTYAGNLENLHDVTEDPRYTFVRQDICDSQGLEKVFNEHNPEIVVHFAAESHVDRSISNASPFITTNVLGTQILLDVSMNHGTRRFLHVSTDEVYGTLAENDPAFTEDTPIAPNSPYAASKAASDLIVRSYHETYGMDIVITRCSNNYGPYQFPEKLIPLMIVNALGDKPLPVYGDGSNVRDWIYVQDHCEALAALIQHGNPGEVYNIGGKTELRNIDLVKRLLGVLEKPESLIEFVTDRPGHDFRYAIDTTRIENEVGWSPSTSFEEGLERTVAWYVNNPDWLASVIDGQYREYYQRMYGSRISQSTT
ncbi:MAG: dTDP-glucose 4,6-dehydratase [bacterium]